MERKNCNLICVKVLGNKMIQRGRTSGPSYASDWKMWPVPDGFFRLWPIRPYSDFTLRLVRLRPLFLLFFFGNRLVVFPSVFWFPINLLSGAVTDELTYVGVESSPNPRFPVHGQIFYLVSDGAYAFQNLIRPDFFRQELLRPTLCLDRPGNKDQVSRSIDRFSFPVLVIGQFALPLASSNQLPRRFSP